MNIEYARILAVKAGGFDVQTDLEPGTPYLEKGHVFRISLNLDFTRHLETDIGMRFYHGDALEQSRALFRYDGSKLRYIQAEKKT